MTQNNFQFDTRSKRCVMVMADYTVPTYLKEFDLEADQGRGVVTVTTEIADALVFPNGEALLECWQTPSSVAPLRRDGKPNRPLTAFSIEVVRAPLQVWPDFSECAVTNPGLESSPGHHVT